jgi:hypothetical protein
MHFAELDRRMRVFETAHDHCVLPGLWMVARIDGRSFTRLTREILAYDRPFDARFRDAMAGTVEHLMQCGFQVLYGYTQSDEISLLLARDETLFSRKLRKYDSVLARACAKSPGCPKKPTSPPAPLHCDGEGWPRSGRGEVEHHAVPTDFAHALRSWRVGLTSAQPDATISPATTIAPM